MERSRLTADIALPREPKQERSRRKQHALLESAAVLFADPGFEEVTADDIAAHAGFGTGTFYNYFTNKTQAFLMVAGLHETAIAPTMESVGEMLSAGAGLYEIARSIVLTMIEDRQKVPWLRRTWLRLALTDPDVDQVQRRLDHEWDAALGVVVAGILQSQTTVIPLTASAHSFATTIRVMVDSVADEVVLIGSLSPEEAASASACLIVGLLDNP
ncbi:MAG: TetR/AcrR family transcriptional regulator [Euzebya sp.]